MLVPARTAVEIIRKEANRPRANGASLKNLVDRGLITPVKIHCRLFAYDPEQIAKVAAKLATFGSEVAL